MPQNLINEIIKYNKTLPKGLFLGSNLCSVYVFRVEKYGVNYGISRPKTEEYSGCVNSPDILLAAQNNA